MTKLFLPDMIKRGQGGIMNVASLVGFFPGPMMSVYYATKAYVLSFSEALENEVSGTGVTVTKTCVFFPNEYRSAHLWERSTRSGNSIID